MKSENLNQETTTLNSILSKFLSLSLLFFFSFSIQAQDEKARDLLNQVTAKVKGYDNIRIDFKYAVNNAKGNINQESKGNVTLKGNQYVLNLMGVTKIFDGRRVYTINPEDEEVSISGYDENDESAITPSKMLTFFNSGYKCYWDILQDVKGRKIQYIKLIPNNSRDSRKELLLGIDVQTKNIYTVIEIGKNGTKTSIVVNSFKTNQPLSKNEFTFVESKYPNYTINK
jgi:outer membrane lipoprotein-sorting protein